ncbi:hypothetical protein [Aquamicrobium zhengzhouense]|uniref:Uncharacterized protein n=1 Tax=Aquamicrobium zhengzhouense TaxID=2781738 RepID=A0ABS0SCB4_9HYPH|nr:hypothetical protein [Aquamicrobium zhengzhouense]MBI1620078.1 hypothetical protein [Aquamicrobium zhengzhouense]
MFATIRPALSLPDAISACGNNIQAIKAARADNAAARLSDMGRALGRSYSPEAIAAALAHYDWIMSRPVSFDATVTAMNAARFVAYRFNRH